MKFSWNILCKIFRCSINILNLIRITIINLFLVILIIIGIIIYFNFKEIKKTVVPSALILDLTGVIVDKPATYTTFQKISRNFFNTNQSHTHENSLFDIVNILRQAKNDPNITGLVLLLKNFSGGNQSSLEYIGKILNEFKNTGKPIYAISDYYNQIQYFLASYANKIYLTPQGNVDLRGISSCKLYYQSLLKNLKVNTHVFRFGSYKSAVEPFIRDNMSHQVRLEEKIWIHQLWNQYLQVISSNRNIPIHQIFPDINIIINELSQLKGNTAYYALQKKWVDEVCPQFAIEDAMQKKFGQNRFGTSFNSISMYDYNVIEPKKHTDQIAIICIQGAITNGINNISSDSVGGETIANKIRHATLNPEIKAIVLRINSPGGSVQGSDLIRQEIIHTRNSGKPIVVSMGNIAASGGYWIATPANVIIASNSTLTGSIGVFGIINTLEKSLDFIGIHSDEVNTSPIANLNITKALPNEFKNIMQLYVDSSYQYFIETVAKFRYKSIVDIDQVAQGHIWLGCDAIKNGLIDKIGDFDDAVKKAAELANLTEYQLNWYGTKINWINKLMQHTNINCSLYIFKIIKSLYFIVRS